jgi:PII-like signaling protein
LQVHEITGLINAVAHHAHYGFSNHGPVLDQGAETNSPYLKVCVEIIGRRTNLEQFRQRHAVLRSLDEVSFP